MSLFLLHLYIYLMKNILKASVAALVVAQTELASAAINFGGSNVQEGLRGSGDTADSAVQSLITNAIGFLYLVAVVFALWGGFNILTAGGDEEKVKKGKTILIQAALGLVVIWLASSIITWIVTRILVNAA
jgi:hypothetical protein